MTDPNALTDDLRAQILEMCDDPDLTNREAVDRIRALLTPAISSDSGDA